MDAILRVDNLTKQYADFKLDHVSFSVPKGTIMGLIGENGASLILATAPGGLSEMCITAKILKLGVPLITAFQVSRLVIVVLFTLPSWRLLELIQRKR